ncbi:hypothetical protein HAX54_037984, partial [Datura stramonium]|nr:hypothetical protein [Datura stramonium]
EEVPRFFSRVRENAVGTPIQSVVGFKPILRSHVASVVHRSVSTYHGLVVGRLLVFSVLCCASASQR